MNEYEIMTYQDIENTFYTTFPVEDLDYLEDLEREAK